MRTIQGFGTKKLFFVVVLIWVAFCLETSPLAFSETGRDRVGCEIPLPEGAAPAPWPADKAPVLTMTLPLRMAGVVVAAPHDGFDRMTGEIAREIARHLGCGLVVCKGFRVPSRRVFFNVNRPTRSIFDDSGKRTDEVESGRALILFDAFAAAVRSAAGLADAPTELYVEIHGHSRRVPVKPFAGNLGKGLAPRVGNSEKVIDVIEIATVGLSPGMLVLLKSRFVRDFANAGISRPPAVFFDLLDPEVSDGIVSAPFRWRAAGAKKAGSLSVGRVRRALHIELPPSLRLNDGRRNAVIAALISTLGWIARVTGEDFSGEER